MVFLRKVVFMTDAACGDVFERAVTNHETKEE